MTGRILAWLRFFRVVNLPTVPGDVFTGAACMIAFWNCKGQAPILSSVWWASLAGVFMYMYGLADNDIVGAPADSGRPIPEGLVSLPAARLARGVCWLGVLACGFAGRLPAEWWTCSLLLLAVAALYNRTKWCSAMGASRALNLLCGAAALAPRVFRFGETRFDVLSGRGAFAALCAAALWFVYIAGVTKYSEGEEADPAKKRFVGILVGAVVYLQLSALLGFALAFPHVAELRFLLTGGAAMLVFLRIGGRLFPKVSAS